MPRRILSASVIAALLMLSGFLLLSNQMATAAQKGKNDRGRQLFVTHCAACHGTDAKGNGPAAPALKTMPSDLTQIPKDKGKFPALKVKRIIGGDDVVTGHGSREMPIWGDIFRQQRDNATSMTNIYALTKYIESIQTK